MEKTNIGLVVGKFTPYHLGHNALIEFAIERCDFLYVVVCEERGGWKSPLKDDTYSGSKSRVIRYPFNPKLRYTFDDKDEQVSKDWAEALGSVLPKIDMVFSSELYGANLAKHLGARNYIFDLKRINVPISGTTIRGNIVKHWDRLPLISKEYYLRTFILCGTESSGKTTIFNMVKRTYPQFGYVPEYGREHGKKGWEVKIKDLETILCTQAHLYEVEKKKLPPVIVMDTNHVTTLGYAKMNGIELKVPRWITRSIKNPTYIMLEGNIPLIDDGTRYGEEGRTALAAIHKQNHTRHRGLTFSITDEGLKDRFINVLRVIEKVMYV